MFALGLSIGLVLPGRERPPPRGRHKKTDAANTRGKVTAEIAKAHAESEFEKYRIVQDRLFESDFDRAVKQIEAGTKPADRDEYPVGLHLEVAAEVARLDE